MESIEYCIEADITQYYPLTSETIDYFNESCGGFEDPVGAGRSSLADDSVYKTVHTEYYSKRQFR